MSTKEKSPEDIIESLHPTKGWRKGEPTFKDVAIKLRNGRSIRDDKKAGRKRVTGGMFNITKKVAS